MVEVVLQALRVTEAQAANMVQAVWEAVEALLTSGYPTVLCIHV